MKDPVIHLLLLCILTAGCFAKDRKKPPDETGKSDPAKVINFYSIEKEISLGKGLADDVTRQSRLLNDQVITEFVNRVAQNLVRNSDSKMPFEIKIIDSEEINAFALPGGFMFVNTGLILDTQDEAELAAVLAHEVAHVAARHVTKQATRGTIVNYATVPLLFMGGWAGYAIREAANFAIPLGLLQYSRAMERQADYLGLKYLDNTGYDQNAFIDFFERFESLQKEKPGTISKLFSTHPVTRSRIMRAQHEIQNDLKPQPAYILDTSEFHEVQNRLLALRNRRGMQSQDNSPALRRRNAGKIEQSKPSASEDDQRPTLKRREPMFFATY